jgi:hypothetical protein
VAASKIPGAGYGAFIEFTGARRLNAVSSARRERLYEEMTLCPQFAERTLEAVPEENGSGVSIKLTGRDLHSKENRLYQPKRAMNKLRAKYSGRTVAVRVVGENIHDVEEFEAYYVSESSPFRSIGYLGTQIFCEYTRDPRITSFNMEDNCINLGRYGPFRREGTARDLQWLSNLFMQCL